MEIYISILTLSTSKPILEPPSTLRGFINDIFPDEPLLHQHESNGLIYIYPRIQYKVFDGKGIVIGIEEGTDLIQTISKKLMNLKLYNSYYTVTGKKIKKEYMNFGSTTRYNHYNFTSPWLALNETNYEKYQKLGSQIKRKKLLQRILVGNILSMSKSLGYTVTDVIKVNIIKIKEITTSIKGNPMLGFLGEFEVNFEIPDYLGIGKSVSRGFGTVKKIR
ncbi:MAG: hypothetical protein JRJ13_08205 [Deltaproteobacteria bacterium]|nr:hypothetical protein [Deltaproteobacteria bacterium]